MKRLFALLLTLALAVGCLAAPAGAIFDPSPVYEVKAQSAYIVNTDTNIIVYEKDSAAQVPAGGLTKLMCAALVLTNYGDELDSRTFQMPFAISDYVYGTDNADMRSGDSTPCCCATPTTRPWAWPTSCRATIWPAGSAR